MLANWWRRGCPGAIGLLPWVLVTPVWLLAAVTRVAPERGSTIGEALLLALCGHLSIAVLLTVATALIDRIPTQLRSRVTLGLLLLIGPIELLSVHALGYLTGKEQPATSLAQTLSAMAFSVGWGCLTGALVDAIGRERFTRGRLLRSLAKERALALQAAGAVTDYRRRVINETQTVVAEQLGKAMDHATDPAQAASRLHTLVDEVVRPLSHELRRTEPDERALVESVEEVRAPSRPPLRQYLRFQSLHMRRLLGNGLVLGLATVLLVGTTDTSRGATGFWATCLLVALGFVYAVALDGVESVIERDDSNLNAAITESEWAAARLRQLAWSERERIGRAIHGDVQALIVATALQLQLGDPSFVAKRLAGLRDQLEARFDAEWADEAWQQSLQRIVDVWRPSIELTVEIAESARSSLEGDAVAAHAFVEVLREAITNAVRHGGADSISAALRRDGDIIELRVSDDGSHMKPIGPAGLGSRMMTAACLHWSIQETQPGHVLTAQITVGGHDA